MYGCRQAFPTEKTADPTAMANSQNAVWENERATCPACRQTISRNATACSFCRTPLAYHGDRMVPNFRGTPYQQAEQTLRTAAIILFIMSFFPCFAPLIVIVTGVLLWRKQKQFARAGQIYSVLTMLSLGISSIYCLIMLCFWLFGS